MRRVISFAIAVLVSSQIIGSSSAALIKSILSKRRAPIEISEEIGCSPTFQGKFFDPLNLATEDNFAIYREAELKHGRIAMLAVLGNTLPDLYRDNIVPPVPFLISPSSLLWFQDVPCGIEALKVVPIFGWLQIISFIGFLENRVFLQRSPQDMPGDYGTGYFGYRNKAYNERALRSELENGRLAMVAFVVQVISELITGASVVDQIRLLRMEELDNDALL